MADQVGILVIGQSNAEPTGTISDYLVSVPEFNYGLLTPDGALGIYYGSAIETIRYLTFYNPEQSAAYPGGATPAPFASYTYDYYAKFLPWTAQEGDLVRPNLNSAGFRYPNCFSVPKGPIYDSTVPQLVPAYPGQFSSDLDFARRLCGHLKQRINIVKLAVPSSRLEHTEADITAAAIQPWAWFDPRIHNNWSPADSNGLFARLRKVLTSARVASDAEGSRVRIHTVLCKLSESDSISATALANFPTNAPAFVAAVRQAIYDAGLAVGSADEIGFVWAGIPLSPWGAGATTINTVLQKMQRDDHYFATYNTDGFGKNSGDTAHYSASGCMQLAEQDFIAYLAIEKRAADAFPEADTITLAEMRTLVRMETERNTDEPGQQDSVINDAINKAYLDLIQMCGDTTWWLRQMTTMTLTSSPTLAVELPRVVTRLLEIRPVAYPLRTIDFSMIGHSDRGRVRIVTLSRTAESVVLHHMYEPRTLVADGQRLFLPRGYIEAVKMGAARRVLANTSNRVLQQALTIEAERLKAQVCMHAQKVDRQRRQRLTGGLRRTRYNWQGTDEFGSDYPWA